jgi:hypothetical protein
VGCVSDSEANAACMRAKEPEMERKEFRVDSDFLGFINLLLRRTSELERLYSEEQYFPGERPMVRFAHIHRIGEYYIHSEGSFRSPFIEQFFVAADTTFRALRDHCRNFAYGDIQELRKLTGYSYTKIEILILLRPGERLSRKSLTRIAYRRQITRALNKLAALELIKWNKRKEITLTQKGTDLRKALIQLYNPFISLTKNMQGQSP